MSYDNFFHRNARVTNFGKCHQWKRLSHKHRVTIVIKPGGTNERILDETDDVLKFKQKHLVTYVAMDDLTNGINLLINGKKFARRSTKNDLRNASHSQA